MGERNRSYSTEEIDTAINTWKSMGCGSTDFDKVRSTSDWIQKSKERMRDWVGEMAYPASVFLPLGPSGIPTGDQNPFHPAPTKAVTKPETDKDLAFLSVIELAKLIQTRQVSPVELTQIYIDRCKKYGPKLFCIINLMEEQALQQAEQAEREIMNDHYRGILHGIPWGLKDMFFTRGVPTTCGYAELKDYIADTDATVVTRLHDAGAILIAKLSLSQGGGHPEERWFGGITRNPWNTEENAKGSSGGPGSATAAGLVGFSLGGENTGSIVNPSLRCGVVGLCPTYGRISHYGAIETGITHNKVGPMCRSAEDCAAVFHTVHGPDGQDRSVVNTPFNWEPDIAMSGLRIGYIGSFYDKAESVTEKSLYDKAFDTYRNLGATVERMEFPKHWAHMIPAACDYIRDHERLSADVLEQKIYASAQSAPGGQTRKQFITNLDTYLKRIITSGDHLLFDQVRAVFCREMADLFAQYDFIIHTKPGDVNLAICYTNFAGFPVLVVPCGFINGTPRGLHIIGKAYDDARLLAVGRAYEQATDWYNQHPDLNTI